MSGIDRQHIRPCANHFSCPLKEISGRADGSADTQTPFGILGSVRILQLFLDVLNRDQPLELVLIVHNQQLFDAMFVEDQLGFFEGCSDRDSDEVVLGHHIADRDVRPSFKAQIAISQDSNEALAARDRHARDLIAPHHFQRCRNGLIGLNRDRIDDHATF